LRNRNPAPVQKTYAVWTRQELDVLSAVWPTGGIKAALEALPGRSENSIRGKVDALCLTMPFRKEYTRYESSEFIDAAIKRAYLNGRPDLTALAKTTGRTKGWLKWRAGTLGVRCTITGSPACGWQPAEDDIVTAGVDAGLNAGGIHKRLHNAGHRRSLNAVVSRIKTLELSAHRHWWTANQVAMAMGYDVGAVTRWIEKGWLRAKRRPGLTSLMENNDARFFWAIAPAAVRDFMLEHPEAWDHRKMHKEVLLDLLVSDRFNAAARKEAA